VLRQFVNIVAFVGTLVMNFLSTTGKLNNLTPQEISNRLPILFVPANYVFGIWGIIYTLLIGFMIYGSLPSQRNNPSFRKIGYWYAVSCAANAIWLVFFHYGQYALSMLAMIALLICLIVIYTRIGVGKISLSMREKWLIQIPFSVYMGWITVATVANASYVLFDAGWNGFGIAAPIWATIMLVVATGITLAIILERRDIGYTAVIVWALIGIVVKQIDTTLVAGVAGVMAAILVVAIAVRYIKPAGLLMANSNR